MSSDISSGGRTYSGTSNQISVSGSVISLANNPVIPGTSGITVPSGTTAERSGSPANGLTRYNSTTSKIEAYENGVWKDLITASSGGGSSALTVYRTSKTVIANNATTTLSISSTPTNGALSFDVKQCILGGENTLALLHFNGADGSTTITDSAQKDTYTCQGNAQIKTDQSKFGGASLYLDGTGDYVIAPDLSQYNIGTGDFTIEMWIRVEALNGTVGQVTGLLHQTNGGGSVPKWYFGLKKASATTAYLDCHFNGGGAIFAGSTNPHTVVDSAWHHVALVVSGGTGTFYFDGTADGTFALTGGLPNPSGNLTIGRQEDYIDQYYQGWIDELRFTKTAVYSTSFTPSASAFADPVDDYNDIYVDSYDAGTAGFGAKFNATTNTATFINKTGSSATFICSALAYV